MIWADILKANLLARLYFPIFNMTSTARLSFGNSFMKLGVALLLPFFLGVGLRAQVTPDGPTYAEVPEDVSVRQVFKSSGNYNMVGTPDIPVLVSVVLSNKNTEEALTVFVTRFRSTDDDKPLDFPYGCAVRITDAKGAPLLQHPDHPDGYWTSLITDAKDDSAFRKDARNRCEVPPKERRAFSVNIATLLAGGTGPAWPIVDGKFMPGAYRFKFRWAGKESPEFSLTIMPK